jgi:hypothetical protein
MSTSGRQIDAHEQEKRCGREYRREVQLPPPAQSILGPIAMLLAPIARAAGYRGRYDKYSGPKGKS